MRIFFCAKSKLQAARSSRVRSLSLTRSVTSVLDIEEWKKYSINSLRSIARETQLVFLRRREQRYWMDVLGKWYDFRAIKLCALYHSGVGLPRMIPQLFTASFYACNRISWLLLCDVGGVWMRKNSVANYY